ncbi:MAG: hypothetical protein ACLTG4_10985 [Oscillospiraceae bacterium]
MKEPGRAAQGLRRICGEKIGMIFRTKRALSRPARSRADHRSMAAHRKVDVAGQSAPRWSS